MLFDILAGDSIRDILISFLLTLPVILIALSFHEAAHAFVAYKMGDRTAYNLGRVTLNPAKHLDPLGSLCMLIFGYGWATPVPINTRNFKNPKNGMALTALAGPVSNLILGLFGILMYWATIFVATKSGAMLFVNSHSYYILTDNQTMLNTFVIILRFFQYFGIMNFLLAVFNIIPIPPFDGSRIFSVILPPRWYFEIMRYERYSLLIVIGLSMVCSRVLGFSPFSWAANGLWNLTGNLFFNIYQALIM